MDYMQRSNASPSHLRQSWASRASGLALPIAALALAGGLLVSCGDPTCVFSPGGCNTAGTTPALGLSAELPEDGGSIEAGAPQVVQSGPIGANVASTTPLTVFFTESISDQNLATAFQLQSLSQFGGLPVPVTPQRIARGHGLALFPITPLPGGETFNLIYLGGDSALFDLTGQALDLADGSVLADFTVALSPPLAPEVIAVWPPEDSGAQLRTPQITVVFDRPLDAGSLLDPAAWTVLAGGNPPVDDVEPVPLASGPLGLLGTETRVWSWESRDAAGMLSPLPANTGIDLVLSPAGSEILGEDGSELPALTFEFTTGFTRPPVGAALTSQPANAIGLANLEVGGGSELMVELNLEEAQGGDVIEILLFGTSLGEDPEFVAVAREIEVPDEGPFDVIPIGLTDLELLDELGGASFADGDLFFGFAQRRGTEVSAIQLLDLDGALAGVQTPLIDTTAPSLMDLGGTPVEDGPVAFRSDARDLALFGRATEPISAVLVTTALGDNAFSGDDPPPVLGSSASGDFLSAPVPLGQLAAGDQDLEFQVVLFDLAMNASVEPFTGTFRQLGGVGPGELVAGSAGSPIEVEVFNAATLEPIVGAQVFSFADQGPGLAPALISNASTTAAGLATVTSHATGQIGTSLAAQAPGFSTFVFQDFQAARLSVGLEPVAGLEATSNASIVAESPLAQLTLQGSDVVFGDSRGSEVQPELLLAGACSPGPMGDFSCALGPYVATLGRPGSLAAFSAQFDLPLAAFTPVLFLNAGEVLLGTGAIDAPGFVPPVLTIPTLFTEPGVPLEELPVAGPVPDVSATATTGIDLDNLLTTAPNASEPRVSLDAPVPGLTGAAVLGVGTAFELSDTDWALRSAYPGELVARLAGLGSPADLIHVTTELEDTSGNLAGVRFPESEVATLGGFLGLASVPSVVAPAEGASTGSSSFGISLDNSLVDGALQLLDPGFEFGSGFYAVRLVDASGALFEIVRADVDDTAGPVELFLPDLAGAGGSGPAGGDAILSARSAGWAGFRIASFLASDERRERNLFARSAPRTVAIP